MPIKLIFSIILIVLVALLTGFNLGNTSNIWFFHTFENVPVIATILVSFIVGVFVTLPFTFGKKRSKKNSEPKVKAEKKGKKNKSKADELKGTSASPSVPAAVEEGTSPKAE